MPLLKISEGTSAPLGPLVRNGGVNFALFSAHATKVTLCLYSEDGHTEIGRYDLPGRSGDIWHGFIKGLKLGQLYAYRVDGPYAPREGHRFNANKLLIDPYAKSLKGDFIQNNALFGYDVTSPDRDLSFSTLDSAPYVPKSVVGDGTFKWGRDTAPNTDWADTIIYEAHLKGLTQRFAKVEPAHRGNFAGLSDPATLSHLKELGVTAIELLPVHSFFSEPRLTNMGLTNYWGYNSVNFFALHAEYLGPEGRASFRDAVKALHKAGIEVILDVVYNHTAESWELGPTLSYRGIDNASYYQLKEDRRYYVNHTGCGNTLNVANPRVLDLVLDSLRFWVTNMHVDGFRFDLATSLVRGFDGMDCHAAFLERVQGDPVLSSVKLIAEPWDVGPNGYALGRFPPPWSEWNDRYRDDVRAFWRGDAGAHQHLAGRMLGSADLFDHNGRPAQSSVNLLSAHDGFTLHDTVSYNHKHNEANGEQNRDGHGHNLSDNMGVEGPTDDPDLIKARRRRKKNMLATLFLSQGVPMLLAGDEFGQTQHGNNNAYCQDNDTSWLDWANRDTDLLEFTQKLIRLRTSLPHLTESGFLHGEDVESGGLRNVEWISPTGRTLAPHEWENAELTCLGMVLSRAGASSIIVLINRGGACDFDLENGYLLLSTSDDESWMGVVAANSVYVFECPQGYIPADLRQERLDVLAASYGLIESYRDISGHIHTMSPAARTALLEAMGVETNTPKDIIKALRTRPDQSDPLGPVSKVFGADKLRQQGGCWGVTASLYGVCSERSWGLGDFEDLACLAEVMAQKGADFIGINPVHALFPSAPHLYAPYSPSSRKFLNVMMIAPDKIVDLPADTALTIPRPFASKFVDYEAVGRTKMAAFEAAFSSFKQHTEDHSRVQSFRKFVGREGEPLRHQALFDTLFETLPKSKQTYKGWKNFPKKYAHPNSDDCQKFLLEKSDRVDFFMYLQWLAHDQLDAAQARAKSAGMSIGIYLDFAVGVVLGGADAWHAPESFGAEVSLGAPGDMANPDGQVWNLLPYNPHHLKANGLEPYRSTLRRNMRLGGAIRIDHILGHMRAFWISHISGEGGYVRFPLKRLLNMIAEESQNANCVVFGEDLGTVPDGFRDVLATHGLMGCDVALIERDHRGQLQSRENMRELSVTGFSNHDFPTLTGFWEGEDFRWREALKIGDDPGVLSQDRRRREDDKAFLSQIVGRDASDDMTPELMADLQAHLAAGPSLAFAVQLDDLLLEPLQANVPGTTDEQPNWRRRARLTLEEIALNPTVDMICRAVNEARQGD